MTARKSRGNIVPIFNGVTLTNYCNQSELASEVERIETTHYGSTAAESIAGDTTFTFSVGGDWDVAVDNAFAPEVITPGTKRTFSYAVTGTSQTVTNTWTSNAEVASYTTTGSVGEKITWSAELALSGAPTRSVA